jgi:uncharacterized membrane protein YbhN (UPF0104 family)
VRAIPAARLWLALGLTAVSYVVLAGYDLLALAYVRARIGARRAAKSASSYNTPS